MNIQKHLLPASLAATVHIAMFWFMPEGTRLRTPAIVEIPPLPPIPPVAPDPVTQPEEREIIAEPVKPLAGGPTPPELPEELSPRKPEDLTIRWIEHVMNTDRNVRIIPAVAGPGDLGGSGEMGRPGIFSIADLDRVPSAKVQLPPDYPAAMRAAKKWRFEPGRRQGKAVPFRLTVPIEFGLEPG